MSKRIISLPEDIINRIAAGEVVERPASVVKELIENSIDADATSIVVKVVDGGKTLIEVADNGTGIPLEDLKKAFERHSTSKITSMDDLDKISTLGFRGEFLASVAAVARVTLETKPEKESKGKTITVEGGHYKESKELGRENGTRITVRDLFYNTPARQKYLKGVRTEFAHVHEIVRTYALAHPNKSFQLMHNDSEVFHSPGTGSPKNAAVLLLGKNVARHLVELDHEESGWKVKGWVVKPIEYRKSRASQYLFLNNRPIRSKLLFNAIDEGYRKMLQRGEYAIVILKLFTEPNRFDPNVHPAKTEVRIPTEEEEVVFEVVVEAIKKAFTTTGVKIPKHSVPRPSIMDLPTQLSIEKPGSSTIKKQEGIPLSSSQARLRNKDNISSHSVSQTVDRKNSVSTRPIRPTKSISGERDPWQFDQVLTKDLLENLEPLGQFECKYIFAVADDVLIVIDQHAADERCTYERLMKTKKRRQINLLEPLVVELTPIQKISVEKNAEVLESFGFQLESFGPTSYRLNSMPFSFGKSLDKQTVLNIVSDLAEGKIPESTKEEEIAALLACHTSIRAGQRLSVGEMKKLFKRMVDTDFPFTCPHGRPTTIRLLMSELDRKFKRT